jgi:hypothetical protein
MSNCLDGCRASFMQTPWRPSAPSCTNQNLTVRLCKAATRVMLS